jgi:uncharacterized protein (TIGR02594 family)
MVQYTAFRRSLRISALALCSAATVAIATPASAKTHHGAARHGYRHHHAFTHHGRHHHLRVSQQELGESPESAASSFISNNSSNFGSSDIVAEARRYIGGNPTGRSRLWCARFMNMVLQRSGHQGTGSDLARSFSSYGHRISGPQVGAIAVMSRHGGGHVGVVSGIDPNGNPIVVSGNHGHRVAESVYPKGRIYAYVMPTS